MRQRVRKRKAEATPSQPRPTRKTGTVGRGSLDQLEELEFLEAVFNLKRQRLTFLQIAKELGCGFDAVKHAWDRGIANSEEKVHALIFEVVATAARDYDHKIRMTNPLAYGGSVTDPKTGEVTTFAPNTKWAAVNERLMRGQVLALRPMAILQQINVLNVAPSVSTTPAQIDPREIASRLRLEAAKHIAAEFPASMVPTNPVIIDVPPAHAETPTANENEASDDESSQGSG